MSGVAGDGGEGRQPVLVRDDAVQRLAGREVAGPADESRHAIGAFPVRVLLAAERRGAGVRPGVVVRAVVGRVHDDGVVGDAEIVEQLQQFADVHVVLDHAVVYSSPLGPEMPMFCSFTWVRKCMRVPFHQTKNGLPACTLRR